MYYDKSINYKKNINDKIGIVVTMNNLSSISFDNDDNIDAINILIDSLQIWTISGANFFNSLIIVEARNKKIPLFQT